MKLLFDSIANKMCKLTQIQLLFDLIESALLSFDLVILNGDKLDLVFETTAVSHLEHRNSKLE